MEPANNTGKFVTAPLTATHRTAEFLPIWGQHPMRVLILEDDLDTTAALSLVLSLDEGFAVDIFHDGNTCLDRLRGNANRDDTDDTHPYDVLMLDVLLGTGQVGTQVLETAWDDPEVDVPLVVVCTPAACSSAYLAIHAPALAARNIPVVLKTFDPDALRAAVRAAVLVSTGAHPRAR
jgi:DNA-binding response OmpR family regulator